MNTLHPSSYPSSPVWPSPPICLALMLELVDDFRRLPLGNESSSIGALFHLLSPQATSWSSMSGSLALVWASAHLAQIGSRPRLELRHPPSSSTPHYSLRLWPYLDFSLAPSGDAQGVHMHPLKALVHPLTGHTHCSGNRRGAGGTTCAPPPWALAGE